MARLKRRSEILELATLRTDGLRSIDETLDLGNGLNLEAFKQKRDKVAVSLGNYNEILAASDEAKNQLDRDEEDLSDFFNRMLMGVAAKFGKNSDEYEKAGGVRKDERKPRSVKPKSGASK